METRVRQVQGIIHDRTMQFLFQLHLQALHPTETLLREGIRRPTNKRQPRYRELTYYRPPQAAQISFQDPQRSPRDVSGGTSHHG